MNLSAFLHQCYPFYYRGKSLRIFTIIVFLFSFTFYFVFEPFEINRAEHRLSFISTCLMHAIVPSIIILLLGAFLSLSPAIEDKWNIKKEFIFFSVYLLFIGLGQFLIRDLIYNNPENWSLKYVIEETKNTFSTGVLFVGIFVPINYGRLSKQNLLKANLINTQLSTTQIQIDKSIFIQTQIKSEDFRLDVSKFLFSRSERNYLEIYIEENNEVKKVLKRISTIELEKQLGDCQNIIKTHRSFLVNIGHIDNVTGNAQGYKLKIKGCNEQVLVSRNRIKALESRMKRHTVHEV